MSTEERAATAERRDYRKVLVCLAVKEEAAPFRKGFGTRTGIKILLTGMGRRNAEISVTEALKTENPDLVLTCGFAGGLRPGLETGAVLYETDHESLKPALEEAGGRSGHFLCSSRV